MVPLGAGAAGILRGPAMFGAVDAAAGLDSHFRYLSGLLLAIGLGFLSSLPRIERQSRRFQLLAVIVIIGGLARLLSSFALGRPTLAVTAALGMELVVTPALALWQDRVARRAGA